MMVGRYVGDGQGHPNAPEYQSVRFQAIGAKGVAGYYEFKPFSAIS